MRKRIARHIESCPACDEERQRLVTPRHSWSYAGVHPRPSLAAGAHTQRLDLEPGPGECTNCRAGRRPQRRREPGQARAAQAAGCGRPLDRSGRYFGDADDRVAAGAPHEYHPGRCDRNRDHNTARRSVDPEPTESIAPQVSKAPTTQGATSVSSQASPTGQHNRRRDPTDDPSCDCDFATGGLDSRQTLVTPPVFIPPPTLTRSSTPPAAPTETATTLLRRGQSPVHRCRSSIRLPLR